MPSWGSEARACHGSFYTIYTQDRVMLLLNYDAARLFLLLLVARGVTECDAPRVTTSSGGTFAGD